MGAALLLITLVLLAAGCGGGEDEREAAGLAGELSYVRTGSVREHLVVQPDGSGMLSRGRSPARPIQVDEARLEALAAAAEQARLGELPQRTTPPAGGGHSIAYDGARVSFDDASIPQQAEPLLAELSRILER